MGWSIGYDDKWERDIGYGVPAVCDHPDCNEEIDRGLSYVCGGEPYGGEYGCGLFFCVEHLSYSADEEDTNVYPCCDRCHAGEHAFNPKPDVKHWIEWKLTHDSWSEWRKTNPEEVNYLFSQLKNIKVKEK